MTLLQAYYRPHSVDEALSLLVQGKGRLVPLAGGTQLIGQLETRTRTNVDGVVDLRNSGIDVIHVEDDGLTVGAMCTLTILATHPIAGSLADGLLMRAARGEGPLNLRNAATVGGCVACAEYDSELYAALLALDASVTALTYDGSEQQVKLSEFKSSNTLITAIHLPVRALTGGAARVARTPSDRPIVAAYAVGDSAVPHRKDVRVALCGIAQRPQLHDVPFDPPDNFKGSAAYRSAMADIVANRAREEILRSVSTAREGE